MVKVAFIGGGSFGTALSILLSKKDLDVAIWDRRKSTIDEINDKHTNIRYLKDVSIPLNVKAYENVAEALEGADYIVLSVPSNVIRSISNMIKEFVKPNQIIVNIAKGIEDWSFKRLSEVISDELPNNPVVVLSGPSHAEEVAKEVPTTVVVSSKTMESAEKVQDLFMTPNFRVYTNADLVGVEIGGAVKNIIALAAGISDGIGCGDNTKAALMTRGIHEIGRIGTKLGGKVETFAGLTGMGDLIVTCTSLHSRNRRAGILIGQGVKAQEAIAQIGMVVEGVEACKAFYHLMEREKVSMPITYVLYKVLFEDLDPAEAVQDLMTRDKKAETY